MCVFLHFFLQVFHLLVICLLVRVYETSYRQFVRACPGPEDLEA